MPRVFGCREYANFANGSFGGWRRFRVFGLHRNLTAACRAEIVRANMNGLIDSHTHLESFVRRGDFSACMERARAAGVREVITIGTSSEDWELYRNLAREHRGTVYFSAGLHPCSVGENWEEELQKLETFWEESDVRPVAIGEMGLDRFHLPKDEGEAARVFAWQRGAFERGLQLAKKWGAPVVVHSRGAFPECVEMIDASGVDWARVVFHCFVEGAAEMRVLMERGGRGSFTGILTYKSAESVREAAKAQGLERLMIETDAPYLTPVPHRGKPNEPSFLCHTAEFAAELFGVSFEELSQKTAAETRRFFGI